MHIGILTLPLHTNYGGILQAYALQTVLQRLGHTSVVLSRHRIIKPPFKKRIRLYVQRALRRYIWRNSEEPVFLEDRQQADYALISQHTQAFIDRYIRYINDDYFTKVKEKDYNALIVGSDQIWRPQYYWIEQAFLLFAQSWHIKRISYAASFGTDEWPLTPQQTAMCRELVKKFDAVSVREDSGVALCKKQLGVTATHVLDPTLLLQPSFYEKLIADMPRLAQHGHMLLYILDETPQKKEIATRLLAVSGMKAFYRSNPQVEDENAPLENRIQPPLEEWLSGIRDADFIVTDSFHACVFSILFRKPFAVVGNPFRGLARIQSLLRQFHLQERLITTVEDVRPSLFSPLPDEVETRLVQLRTSSLSFLTNALSMP